MWNSRPPKGTILHVVNKWFSDCGATCIGPWLWSSGPLQTVVDLNVSLESLGLPLRRVREIWRYFQWNAFKKGTRHEVPEMVDVSDAQFFSVDWKSLRSWISGSPSMRSVACGAFLSPAAMHVAGAPFDYGCVWDGCDVSIASFHHLVWECPCRPQVIHPLNAMDARYGWCSINSLRWIAKVQETLWTIRHDSLSSHDALPGPDVT